MQIGRSTTVVTGDNAPPMFLGFGSKHLATSTENQMYRAQLFRYNCQCCTQRLGLVLLDTCALLHCPLSSRLHFVKLGIVSGLLFLLGKPL